MAFRQSPGRPTSPTDINDVNINESGLAKQPDKCLGLNIIGGRSSGPLAVFDFNFLITFRTAFELNVSESITQPFVSEFYEVL